MFAHLCIYRCWQKVSTSIRTLQNHMWLLFHRGSCCISSFNNCEVLSCLQFIPKMLQGHDCSVASFVFRVLDLLRQHVCRTPSYALRPAATAVPGNLLSSFLPPSFILPAAFSISINLYANRHVAALSDPPPPHFLFHTIRAVTQWSDLSADA